MQSNSVTTKEVRLSYVHLLKPYAQQTGQAPKYSCTVLLPKADVETKAAIDAAVEDAKQTGVSTKWNGVLPPKVDVPIHDGDGTRPSDGMPFGAECKGCWVFTASATESRPPEVVNAQCERIISASEVYSGMYARINITFFPYMVGGKRGIGIALGPVQKTRDGETLGGSTPSAADVFGKPTQAQRINPITGLPM